MNRSISEFALIASYFAPLAEDPAALGLKDDACLIPQDASEELVVTSDALIEGVHFFATDPPELIAAKALRVNLSDLAAKGAKPRGYLMALALPRALDEAWLKRFCEGLAADQKAFGVSLLGGDTTATPGPFTIAITALGVVPKGKMIRRSGAHPGDTVFVSGTIGDAGGGLAVLQNGAASDYLIGRYRKPTPRLSLGQGLRDIATASLDVSDGLLADLGHIAEVSKVRLVIEADRIPLSSALRALWPGQEGIIRAATAGDDYEIAFTARPCEALARLSQECDVSVTSIGVVEAGEGVVLLDSQGIVLPVSRPGYVHF